MGSLLLLLLLLLCPLLGVFELELELELDAMVKKFFGVEREHKEEESGNLSRPVFIFLAWRQTEQERERERERDEERALVVVVVMAKPALGKKRERMACLSMSPPVLPLPPLQHCLSLWQCFHYTGTLQQPPQHCIIIILLIEVAADRHSHSHFSFFPLFCRCFCCCNIGVIGMTA